MSNLNRELWLTYQECYLRLQKFEIKEKGKPSNEIAEIYLKTKEKFFGGNLDRRLGQGGENQKEIRANGSRSSSADALWEEAQRLNKEYAKKEA